ncbi:hypothetical protein [Leifsonia sp. Le1]|uniref:hypothetical protein n=1 Tax=Leifsonia sp. Le1 TaxID=3404918 RepID=UPI003EBAE50A
MSVSGCAEVGAMMTSTVQDAAGMTRGEVEQLTPEQRFDLYRERYERVKELMTEAQEQVSSESWDWLSGGVGGPAPGSYAYDPLAGSTGQNTYCFDMTRSINPPGATGERADAEPVYDYFESKGWAAELIWIEDELSPGSGRYDVRAITDDGYRLIYEVQENGQYNMSVISQRFWGDRDELSSDITYRIPKGQFFPPDETSVPGVYIPFPKWSDPKLWGPDVEED